MSFPPVPPSKNPNVTHGRDVRAPFSLAAALLVLGVQSAPSGDILRGGAASTNANRPVGPSPAAAQAAAQSRSNAKDALARTSRAVEAVQRAQLNAARASVHANNAGPDPTNPGFQLPGVPNGLVSGGLQVAPGVGTDLSLWTGAFLPTQTSGGGKTQVTVKQTSQQALLNWQTFNVGRDTNLHFDQSAGGESVGQWIAFNKVNDPTGRPSQILGSITAPGQVYVVNQNGIIFGGASQINVHTLVASSLPINDNLISRGLLNQSSTAQFLFSGLPQAGDVPFTPPVPPPGGRYGDVTVQPGAQLVSPTTDANVGGRIALVGANVRNLGTISTADGQAILAAGLQVGLAAHSASDPSLRGLDAFVGDVGTYAGTATNEGLIQAPRGSVAITGRSVNQLGAIDSSTSVSLNGRIDLRAEYGAIANPKFDPVFSDTSPPFLYGGLGVEKSTGQVTVGPGSVMRILPEWGSADKVIGTSLALRSQVNVRGGLVYFGPGAMLQAPNGNVTVQTGVWDLDGPQNRTAFVRNSGQIYVERDTLISVAGTTDAPSPLSNHILTVTLRSSELADAPLQRNSFFRGGDITVDLRKTGTYNGRDWVGTPLADLRGYLNIIERTVDELTVAGGSVNLNSGGSIVVQPGAVIDTSAGWLNYGSGYVKTTRLLRQGRLVDIATATPDVVYDRIFTGLFEDLHPRWNITRTYRVPWMDGEHFEDGYLSGGNAGNLSFAAASMALDGFFRGGAVSGPRQTEIPAQGGTLDLSFEVQKLVAGGPLDPLISPTPPQVVFQDQNDQRPADPFATDAAGGPLPLRADRQDRVVLAPAIFEAGGFAALRVRNPDGNITVPKGTILTTAVKGSITLEGANVSIFGDVKAPGGNLSFLAYNISPGVAEALRLSTGAVLPVPNAGRGIFTLGAGSNLSAAGQITDYRPGGNTSFNVPVVNDGGRVSIKSYSASLAAGSEIDVSGGVVAGVRGG
jgi:filamentous hemagglutinin family protein